MYVSQSTNSCRRDKYIRNNASSKIGKSLNNAHCSMKRNISPVNAGCYIQSMNLGAEFYVFVVLFCLDSFRLWDRAPCMFIVAFKTLLVLLSTGTESKYPCGEAICQQRACVLVLRFRPNTKLQNRHVHDFCKWWLTALKHHADDPGSVAVISLGSF